MASLINEFLRRSAQVYISQKPFTLVLGNEGGDMDSIIGSIYLAFYLEKQDNLGTKYYIPAINFLKEDFPLRNDVINLFSRYGLKTDDIFSTKGNPGAIDFMDLKNTMPNVVLYDHNKLISSQNFLNKNVIGVIDHHFDEKLYMDQTKGFRRIETTGSACTLVSELFREAGLEVPCAELLLAPIVLDTVNFNPSQKKVTEKDVRECQWLIQQINVSIDLTKMFNELSKWKSDILGLTFLQHLRRDYKDFEFSFKESNTGNVQIGISSIACRFDEFLSSRSLKDLVLSCLEFLNTNKLDAILLAFAGERGAGNHCRQFAFLAKGNILKALQAYAESTPDGVSFTPIENLQYSEWSLMSYELSDPSISRKKLAPSLSMFISSWPKL